MRRAVHGVTVECLKGDITAQNDVSAIARRYWRPALLAKARR